MQSSSELTLVIETSDGTWLRRIQPASPLRDGVEPGYAAEEATRDAGARWGLPDFIFRPTHSTKGRASREVGDALVIAGDLAACVQVKLRTRSAENPNRERLWLNKKIEEAERQATGSLKQLERQGQIELVNERGRRVLVTVTNAKWLGVVILDHPGIDEYTPKAQSSVVLLRRDWEFLFDQLKSTYAVLQYLHHVSRDTHGDVPLGDEPVRYYKVAQASLNKTPDPPDQRLYQGSGISAPVFPLAPARGAEIVRGVLEDIALLPIPEGVDPAELLTVLAAIDSTPLAIREDLSTQIVRWFRELTRNPDPDGTTWRSRRYVSATHHHLIFAVCSRKWTPDVQAQFATLLELRHQEHFERTPERQDLMSVGVLLTPRDQGWDTTLVATSGDQRIDPSRREILIRLWGTWDTPGTDPALSGNTQHEP